MFLNFAAVLILFLVQWLVLRSTRPQIAQDYRSLELTSRSLTCFAGHLKGGPASPLVVKLRKHLATNETYQHLCLTYLIGSVAVFGEVDKEALRAICELCRAERVVHLSDFVDELIRKNDACTAASFIAANVEFNVYINYLGLLIIELVREDWHAMEMLTMRILAVLEKDASRSRTYHLMLRFLPAKQRYEMLANGTLALNMISKIYSVESFDPLLREIFILARCSRAPKLQIREYIAAQNHHFTQFLSDRSSGDAAIPCPGSDADPSHYVWGVVFRFLDVETLMFVLPLVCTFWRNSHPTIMAHSSKVHDLYLQDLSHFKLSEIHQIIPWRCRLRGREDALGYLGWCIANDALGRFESNEDLQFEINQYLEAVISGETALPKIGNCTSPYGSFVKLFELVYEICTSARPTLDKPASLASKEYERAIHHFVCIRKWALKLPDSLIVDDIPRLFTIIGEDETLMRELIDANFCNFVEPSIALIMHRRPSHVLERLKRLIFSQTELFSKLVGQEFLCPDEYYKAIADSNILPDLVIEHFDKVQVNQLLVSLVLSFKNDPEKLGAIVVSIADRLSSLEGVVLMHMRWWLETKTSRILANADRYSTEDAEFFKAAMTRCGVLEEHGS